MSQFKHHLSLMCDADFWAVLARLEADSGAADIARVIQDAVALYDWARLQKQAGLAVGAGPSGSLAKAVALPFKPSASLTQETP